MNQMVWLSIRQGFIFKICWRILCKAQRGLMADELMWKVFPEGRMLATTSVNNEMSPCTGLHAKCTYFPPFPYLSYVDNSAIVIRNFKRPPNTCCYNIIFWRLIFKINRSRFLNTEILAPFLNKIYFSSLLNYEKTASIVCGFIKNKSYQMTQFYFD